LVLYLRPTHSPRSFLENGGLEPINAKSVRYTAKAVAGDTAVDMYLRITEAVPTGNGDLLTTIASYPQASAEDQNSIALAENALTSYE